jgi:hypothetical protein
MRASDRDRERAVALLRARCVEGYLSVDTFEYRLGRALAARTALELRLLVADVARARRRLRLPGSLRAPASIPSARVALPSESTLVIGRGGGCDVHLDDRTVSRRHLELRALEDSWMAIDLGSTNGTWLQGRRTTRARVAPGDELVLGDYAIFLEAPISTGREPSWPSRPKP